MNDATVDRAVRARLTARTESPTAAHLVLLDHHMVPRDDDVSGWVAEAVRRGFRTVRTSALFPEAQAPFLTAGFAPIDRLALLERELTTDDGGRPASGSTRRLRARDLPGAAAVDRAAFGAAWANDAASLADIGRATPHHRSRAIGRAPVVAFAISGRAGTTGYVQRLAVDPARQRAGLGRRLLADSLAWMVRHGVAKVLVNTGVDNKRALALYTSTGFLVRPDELVVMERRVDR